MDVFESNKLTSSISHEAISYGCIKELDTFYHDSDISGHIWAYKLAFWHTHNETPMPLQVTQCFSSNASQLSFLPAGAPFILSEIANRITLSFLQRNELRKSRMELLAAQDEARLAREEARQFRADLRASQAELTKVGSFQGQESCQEVIAVSLLFQDCSPAFLGHQCCCSTRMFA